MHRYRSQQNTHLRLAVGVTLAYSTLAAAQWHGHPGFGPGGSDSGGGGGGGPGSFSGFGSDSGGQDSGFGPQGFSGSGGPGFDIDTATRYRTIHGILAALAFVVLFPMGSIFMRIIPGRLAIWVHAVTQVIGYVVYIAAAALGFWMVQEVRIPFASGNLLSFSAINYHPIIGIVVLVALFIQPFLGLMHHSRFKKLRRRQVWSHLHIWNGRLTVPLAIVNGGLGLRLAGAAAGVKTAYAVIAAVMVALWAAAAVLSECRRRRADRRASRGRLARRVKVAEAVEASEGVAGPRVRR